MKGIAFGTFLVSMLFLTSCNSFNTYNIGSGNVQFPAQAEWRPSKPVVTPVSSLPEEKLEMCTKLLFPELPPVPEPPLQSFRKTKPGEYEKIDKINLQYISDLRTHAIEVQNIISTSRAKWRANCTPTDLSDSK